MHSRHRSREESLQIWFDLLSSNSTPWLRISFVGCFFFPSHLALYCKYTQYSEIYTASINTAMRPVTVLSRLGLCVTVHGKGQYYNNVSATQW